MEETGTTEAGAVPVTATAEAQGQVSTTATDNTAGAVPTTESAEVQDGQAGQTTTTEGAQGVTEGSTETGKAAHQTTLEERVQALAEKRISEVETKLTAKLEEVTRSKVEEKPNFYEIDMAKVNQHFVETLEQIEALKLEGRILEAMDLQDDLNATRQELRDNEQRKAEWIQRTQAQQQGEQFVAQMNKRLEDAGDLVAKEHNIPAEVWEKGKEFFRDALQKSPLLQRQYDEKVLTQGPIAAVLFAKEYVEKNMGAKEQQLIDKKEAAKTTLLPGKTSSGEPAGNADLAALRAKAAASGNAEDLAAYTAAKSRAAAT